VVAWQWNSLSPAKKSRKDISYYVWYKNPSIGTDWGTYTLAFTPLQYSAFDAKAGVGLTSSEWPMVYGTSTFESYDQDPKLWEPGSDHTKQSGNWDDPVFYVRRLCLDCSSSHQDIFYKRLTKVPLDMNIKDLFLSDWIDTDNKLRVDFELYSIFEDALINSNRWKFCNYNDRTIGFPRDCGPDSGVGWQWNSLSPTKKGRKNVSYYVWFKNPSIGTYLLSSEWAMVYGMGSLESEDQNPKLWEPGSDYTKQNGNWDDPVFYIRRLCLDCSTSHQDIIYKRLTKLPSYMNIEDWVNKNNVLGVDFELYSTFEDALSNSNK